MAHKNIAKTVLLSLLGITLVQSASALFRETQEDTPAYTLRNRVVPMADSKKAATQRLKKKRSLTIMESTDPTTSVSPTSPTPPVNYSPVRTSTVMDAQYLQSPLHLTPSRTIPTFEPRTQAIGPNTPGTVGTLADLAAPSSMPLPTSGLVHARALSFEEMNAEMDTTLSTLVETWYATSPTPTSNSASSSGVASQRSSSANSAGAASEDEPSFIEYYFSHPDGTIAPYDPERAERYPNSTVISYDELRFYRNGDAFDPSRTPGPTSYDGYQTPDDDRTYTPASFEFDSESEFESDSEYGSDPEEEEDVSAPARKRSRSSSTPE